MPPAVKPVMTRGPRWPIYIVSKGRWEQRFTSKALEIMRVPYRVIVEPQEYDRYSAVIDARKLLVLDDEHRQDYDPCCDLTPGQGRGSGPARNFAWDHAAALGAEWHWVVDDNIMGFYRLNKNVKALVGDGTVLRCMEDFAARFSNVAMAGPNYKIFAPRRQTMPPFYLNTRVYSCNLIRTAAPFRWRCRYNEDTDLSLRMLKAGHCTILFNAFLQDKRGTLTIKGGNTEELYQGGKGNLAKSRMLARLHPDVAAVVKRWDRWHHRVDYSGFRQRLVADPTVSENFNGYGMELIELSDTITYSEDWRKYAR